MRNYRYFENAEENAYFTDTPCSFCKSEQFCLDGVFFKNFDGIESICLDCFDEKKISVKIPDYIKAKISSDIDNKADILQFNPPVPWIQDNDWPVCCDDFMIYIGEWEQDDFNKHSDHNNGIELLKKLIDPEISSRVDSFEVLWDQLGDWAAAFTFRCPHCGKKIVIIQDY